MEEVEVRALLSTPILTVRDVMCRGICRHRSEEECTNDTRLVFHYRGVYIRHVGRDDAVAEGNQVLFFNAWEGYHVSHPVAGGDACLDLAIDDGMLHELAPRQIVHSGKKLTFVRQRLRL